jgi:hypothetical protein
VCSSKGDYGEKLKANLQRESRQADTKFMQDIVSEDLHKNPKRFSGITSLKNKDGYLHSDTVSKANEIRLTAK